MKGEQESLEEEALKDVLLLLDLAISRSRSARFSDYQLKESIRGALEAAKQELTLLRNQTGPTDSPDRSLRKNRNPLLRNGITEYRG